MLSVLDQLRNDILLQTDTMNTLSEYFIRYLLREKDIEKNIQPSNKYF